MLYGPKLILAVIVLIVGMWVIGRIANGVGKMLKNKGLDPAVQSFLKSMVSILLKLMLIISVASMFGVETTSFIAVLGAMGLAIGLALQGSLGNFAGGVLILIFKPYKIGDQITSQGETGVVNEIQVLIPS
ncbi:MAG: small conductance mechanosensitive channel [Limisphaerales bacterium]|jgi:small conductance mechanosensitive channel